MQMTKLFRNSALLFLAICSAPTAFGDESASPHYLTGKDLRLVFDDTTMKGEYRIFRDLTKTYRYTEHHTKDGKTHYIEGKRIENGLWKIIGQDKICYRYPDSKDYNSTYCFYVYNIEGCYYKFSPYNMTLHGPRDWELWTSRAVRKGHGGSCEAPVG